MPNRERGRSKALIVCEVADCFVQRLDGADRQRNHHCNGQAFCFKERSMIDDPNKTDLPMAMLKESVPDQAIVTPNLANTLAKQSPEIRIPAIEWNG
jgi:hypothetical protein